MMPELAWRSPIFHPNISSSGVVCLGGYGTFWAPSLNLDDLCVMLWDMVRYANYDVNSPYNREAALWAKTQEEFQFPVDARPLRDRVAVRGPGPTEPSRKAASQNRPEPPEIEFLGDVIETPVIVAEVVDEPDVRGRVHGGTSPFARPEILIIE
jgi:hypothetical protein